MDSKTFDAFTVRFGAKATRRRVVTRLAPPGRRSRQGGAAALAATFGRPLTRGAAAQSCPYGANTCASGYVWREAFPGDVACVDPSQRDQAAFDNANQAGRYDPNGPYGIYSCVPGYVWRDAYDGDGVCVEPWVRDQVHFDNSQVASRIAPGCQYETTT